MTAGQNLLGVAFGYMPSRELVEAINRDVFKYLDTTAARTPGWMARQCGVSEQEMEVLLDALAAMGFVTYSQEGYSCPAPNSPDMLEVASIFGDPDLVKIVWAAPGETINIKGPHQFWDRFAKKFHGIAEPNAIRFAKEIIPPWVEKYQIQRVLDVGASHGLYGLHVAKQHPEVEVTLLDWSDPESGTNPLDEARANAEKLGVADRVHYVDGSLWEVLWDKSIENRFDMMIWSALIHHFPQEECERLCRRAAMLFREKGVLAIQDFITEHRDPAKAPFAYEFRAFMRRFTGRTPTLLLRQSLEKMLTESGFAKPTVSQSVIWPASWLIAERR
jgi:2-polyprenyl-3-methyl-5-hydroxy-6-metoxy-1,4-benzoquinol methylase